MLALLLILAVQTQDPVQLQARLTNEAIVAGETTILRVEVRTDGPRAQIRPFRSLPPGIEVAGTRDYDQRQFSLPGGTRRFITREFVLRARAVGRYRIPAVEVVVEGNVYTTASTLLTVGAAPDLDPAPGASASSENGVSLRAWLDADTVYVGQQVNLTVEAAFSQEARMRLRRAPEYEAPSPSGFWVHDLPSTPATTRMQDGRRFEVQRFRKAFFPLAAGEYRVSPARLEYEIRRGLLNAPEVRDLTTDSLSLVVLPIPGGAPAAFTGAVGDYDVSMALEPREVSAGEAAVLTVTVEGTGNVKTLPPPDLPDIPALDVFDPGEESATEVRGDRVGGEKAFRWVVVPRRAGEVEIPGIRYAFFVPETGGFSTAAVAPLRLRVAPAAAGVPGSPNVSYRYVKPLPSGESLAWVNTAWFRALYVLPLILVALATARRRGWGRVPGTLARERRRRFRELESDVSGGDLNVLAGAESFVRTWLARRFGVPEGRAGDAAVLEEAGVAAAAARRVARALEASGRTRYAPEPPSPEALRDVIKGLGRALEEADRSAIRSRRRTGAGAAMALVLVLPVALEAQDSIPEPEARVETAVVQGSSETGPPGQNSFFAGVDAFGEGRYDEATRQFQAYTEEAPDDPSGWFNLGNAYHQAGAEGRAIRAWLRAHRLAPRDDDVRHNLLLAGARPELMARVRPGLPLAHGELRFLLVLSWVLAGALGALWILRRGRVLAGLSLASLGVTAAMGILTWAGETRSTRIVLEPTDLRAGPALAADPVASLEAGVGVIPSETYGDWIRVRTLSGEEGWVEPSVTAAP